MKPLTEQQIKEHSAATLRGAIEGTVGSGIVAGAGTYYLQRRWGFYRSLPISLKVLGAVILVAPCLSIQAERRGLEYDKSQWTGTGVRALEQKAAAQEGAWEQLTMGQKVGDWAGRHEYSLIMGSWALSLAVAGAVISRDRYQSIPQKVVQARMWAQGLTVGVIIAAGALTHRRRGERNVDHSWADVIEPNEPTSGV